MAMAVNSPLTIMGSPMVTARHFQVAITGGIMGAIISLAAHHPFQTAFRVEARHSLAATSSAFDDRGETQIN